MTPTPTANSAHESTRLQVGEPRPPVSVARLWFGVGAAPVAWAIAELIGYALAARSCERGVNGLGAYGVGRPGLAVGGLVAITASIAAAGLYTAFGSLVALRRERPPTDRDTQVTSGSDEPWTHGAAPAWTRARFMALAGVLTSALFLLGIVLFGIPPALVDLCNQVR